MNQKSIYSKFFTWDKGRQNTGYEKMLIASGRWPNPFDVYILRFSEGDEIPLHVDKVKNGEHYRLNIVLWSAKSGGKFICANPIYESNRVKFFRSDSSEHAVSKVVKGRRYVMSIGWVKSTK
ncbi:2OG-Fe(II) oxygenase [Aestuariirhabdus sp. Z084]|uniref:2OG-Fe(II) oxygenase n=1 Tax=Aestuariirhabdus haliotis TaxID=2918751 RepID=UPI00201B3E75|nr:2OG-Fe(II) oxygenase [Aestuariirhabdus haliotis]MCL6414069.1 2OG-Fe(II) oxygenase [Aestuariirhabdus haliotis]MCL6418002.1 2OG-Fe(II) oxygenase [Aestuariirhabdus haliotis]